MDSFTTVRLNFLTAAAAFGMYRVINYIFADEYCNGRNL